MMNLLILEYTTLLLIGICFYHSMIHTTDSYMSSVYLNSLTYQIVLSDVEKYILYKYKSYTNTIQVHSQFIISFYSKTIGPYSRPTN